MRPRPRRQSSPVGIATIEKGSRSAASIDESVPRRVLPDQLDCDHSGLPGRIESALPSCSASETRVSTGHPLVPLWRCRPQGHDLHQIHSDTCWAGVRTGRKPIPDGVHKKSRPDWRRLFGIDQPGSLSKSIFRLCSCRALLSVFPLPFYTYRLLHEAGLPR